MQDYLAVVGDTDARGPRRLEELLLGVPPGSRVDQGGAGGLVHDDQVLPLVYVGVVVPAVRTLERLVRPDDKLGLAGHGWFLPVRVIQAVSRAKNTTAISSATFSGFTS